MFYQLAGVHGLLQPPAELRAWSHHGSQHVSCGQVADAVLLSQTRGLQGRHAVRSTSLIITPQCFAAVLKTSQKFTPPTKPQNNDFKSYFLINWYEFVPSETQQGLIYHLKGETETSLSPGTSFTVSKESHGVPRPDRIYNPSREFWVSSRLSKERPLAKNLDEVLETQQVTPFSTLSSAQDHRAPSLL